ncbi:uncharacterized protein LOC116024685 isoform X2 [Ipomoea triloba]|uniref:uncharacterized protein LOC116024685 isoform X2 n=1 Tax=Ipomoea triloba TaxID=35885 RepID=UPI00125E5CB3|nr:uncharacterized protein LOC116024685 isoform X2 [Ipomoea triloba]
MKTPAFIKDMLELEKWNIQIYVMASLVFQMILIHLAPMRRWTNNGFMYLVIWAVYLLATFFSTFALSLIYNDAPDEVNKSDIFPFWAPFLLVHLGGPHTITALAMEDNNLWHRHLLTQTVQVCSVLVVFYQYKIFQSEWLLPTAIVFLVGIVKGIERINSLHLASFNYVRRTIRHSGKTTSSSDNVVVDEYEIIRRGFELYQTFKGFIIDHTFRNKDECGTGREWLSELGEEDAFKVMEMEVNFMYQAMFTKMSSVQSWKHNYLWLIWFIWRFLCHALLITVAVIFFCHSKNHLKHADIVITYLLLGGAVVLDEIAIIHLIFSHWTIAKITRSAGRKEKKAVRSRILPVIYGGLKAFTANKCWSGKIIQYSLVGHSLRGRRCKWAETILNHYSVKEVIDSGLHTKTAKVGPRLKKLVVEDIKRKVAAEYEDVGNQGRRHVVMDIILPLVQEYISDDYATLVLTLHVATEICYFTTGEGDEEDAKLCLQISQYLAYLLVLEGNITSALPGSIGIGMRFKDICEEQAHHTFNDLYDTFNAAGIGKGIWCWKQTSRQEACECLIKKEYSKYEKSVLPKAVELAKAMNTQCADPEAGNNSQGEFWKGLSEVWVGLLVYASAHCRGDVYYLNKGGQFYTFVRLLMAHFGLQESLKGERPFQLRNEIHY